MRTAPGRDFGWAGYNMMAKDGTSFRRDHALTTEVARKD
jgi:hypothetical protein